MKTTMGARDVAKANLPTALWQRYRPLFVLGRGGMGSVEAALEVGDSTRAFQRVVALKRILPDMARDARRVEMFLREAKVAAMLDHPNVVRALDCGEVAGELYLAMEYVEGQSLSRLVTSLASRNESLPPPLVAHVLAEICEGLHAAHELEDSSGKALNLVHRDVSPQNVMIGYDGSVRLLDFGVAKIETENVTKTGEVKGKTAYMSPEQAMGDAIDRRSDLFGVGAVLYEAVTLRRMWGNGTDMEIIRKLALESPPTLEGADERLVKLHARLVSRSAADRPANAYDVAEAFRSSAFATRAEGTKALSELMMAHFGRDASEQRSQLTRALDDIAPDQARELRESVLPSEAPAPPLPALPSASPGPKPVRASRLAPAIGAVSIAALGVLAFRVFASGPSRATHEPRLETPTASTIAPPILPTVPSAPPPAVSSSTAPSSTPSPRTPLRPVTSSMPRIRVTPTTIEPSARPVRPPDPPKPPDVDPQPF